MTQFQKYVWLIDTISRNGMISHKELTDRWERNKDMSESKPLARATFNRWRDAIFDQFGIIISCQRVGGYLYYIENPEEIKDDNLKKWMLDTFAVGNLISENIPLKRRILIDKISSGYQYLTDVLSAMREGRALEMTYQGFQRREPSTFIVEPWCVKLFEQRWYMLGKSEWRNQPYIYALDRIKGLAVVDREFELPADFDAETFFADFYGIVISDEEFDLTPVALRADALQSKYFRTLPLHHSQVEVERTDEYSVFEYRLCPTYDFRQKLLSLGDRIKVLAPKELIGIMERSGRELVAQYILHEEDSEYCFKRYKK